MSRRSLDLNYKESQIIRHSLQISIRHKSMMKGLYDDKESFNKEIREEEKVLTRVTEFVEEYKEIISK